jgi:mannose-6-phosphate isomerase-like protein (cupin superfamily)
VSDRSKVVKHSDFRWQGVPERAYKEVAEGQFCGVVRQTLLGLGEGEEDLSFLTRYFEIAPGGWSSLERHQHPHAVIVLRGRGSVVLEGVEHPLEPFDCVYVAPGAPHQFRAADEPLGFLCVVDRERDRPEPLEGPGEPSAEWRTRS